MKQKIKKAEGSTMLAFLEEVKSLDTKQELIPKVSNQELTQYGELVGRLLLFLERSLLPLDRKVFYQIAILSGYLSDELMESLMKEADRAIELQKEEIKKLEDKVAASHQHMDQLLVDYAVAAEKRQAALEKLQEGILVSAEKKVESIRKEGTSAEIQKIKQKLNSHGKSA